jgi:hypothetical protein
VVVLLVDALQPTTLLVSSCSPGLHVNREGLGQKDAWVNTAPAANVIHSSADHPIRKLRWRSKWNDISEWHLDC